MMLTLPVIAVERKRSPFQVIRRSWELTRGNAGRILLYVALLAIAVFFIIAVAIIGIVMALLAGPQAAQIANAVIVVWWVRCSRSTSSPACRRCTASWAAAAWRKKPFPSRRLSPSSPRTACRAGR